MIRHYLIAALRAMAANKLLSAISILGLAVGLTGAVLMALVIRNQATYDHFIPGYARTYLAVSVLAPPGMPPVTNDITNVRTAALVKLNVPDVRAAARLMPKDAHLKRAQISATEKIYWADANSFDLLPLPVLHGTLATALIRPDGLVVNAAIARKYFGREEVVGQTLSVNGHPMIIMAVIADLPANGTDLETGIFASGRSAFSAMPPPDANPRGFSIDVRTYLQLAPGADIAAVQNRLPSMLRALVPPPVRKLYGMPLVRIDRLALFDGLHPGIRSRLVVGGLIALLILFIAASNFVLLALARANRRAREIGVRKVSGAGRRQLMAQFLGEATLTIALAALLAVAASEALLPAVNAYLQTGAVFDYAQHPALVGWLLVGIGALGLLAGFYPALVLSALRPAKILRGGGAAHQAGPLRSVLVVAQFAILIGLLIATAVVYQQRLYATGAALRVPTDDRLIVHGPCKTAFRDEVRKLPGVAGAVCSGEEFLTGAMFGTVQINGVSVATDYVSTDYGAFALYGLKPLAGILPATEGGNSRIVINAQAARRFGFATPAAALGHILPGGDAMIVAVVPDFALYSVESAVKPTIYENRPAAPHGHGIVQIALKGPDRAATLAAIDRLWTATGNSGPIDRAFLSDQIQALYANLRQDTQLFGLFSGLAAFLACLGLIGIAIASAEHRTKEIGIRKAAGASNRDIVLLLLWQFGQPVLWANLIAWPLAWWAMNRWLSGFAYHVELHAWLFVAASAAALTIALITVAGQALLVARQKPVLALRYE